MLPCLYVGDIGYWPRIQLCKTHMDACACTCRHANTYMLICIHADLTSDSYLLILKFPFKNLKKILLSSLINVGIPQNLDFCVLTHAWNKYSSLEELCDYIGRSPFSIAVQLYV